MQYNTVDFRVDAQHRKKFHCHILPLSQRNRDNDSIGVVVVVVSVASIIVVFVVSIVVVFVDLVLYPLSQTSFRDNTNSACKTTNYDG